MSDTDDDRALVARQPCALTRRVRSDTLPRMIPCPSCGTENPAGAKFCPECGAALVADPRRSGDVRKTVTILFADVAGSTALGEELDPETLRSLMDGYFTVMRGIIEAHGGTVEKFIGDAVMAVFGIPVIHEDDALRAVRAADAIRTRPRRARRRGGARSRSLTFRTGINTGEVFARDPTGGQAFVTGDPVNTAARLEQAAGPGEILLGETHLPARPRRGRRSNPSSPSARRARPNRSPRIGSCRSTRRWPATAGGSTRRSSAGTGELDAPRGGLPARRPRSARATCSRCSDRRASARAG